MRDIRQFTVGKKDWTNECEHAHPPPIPAADAWI
jgi:hypothetical protein